MSYESSTQQRGPQKPRFRLRRIAGRSLLVFVGILVGLLIAEVFARGWLALRGGGLTHAALVENRKSKLLAPRQTAAPDVTRRFEGDLVLHPLFGYTLNPKLDGVNNFGFRTEYDFALKNNRYVLENAADRQRLVVGVFGGSFAYGIGGRGDYFAKKLAADFPDKQIVLVNMAIGGQAVPQSAFIYMYFRDLFDVVVFVDGLNELWNYTQNNRDGAPPEYAKATHYRYKLSKEALSPATFALTSQLIEAESKLRAWTAFSLRPVIRDSVLVHYLWQQRAAALSQKVGEISMSISQQFQGGERFFPNSDAEVLAFAARQWQAYHELVHRTATAQGTLSLHILQPNPFVPESKPLTPTELELIHHSFPVQSFVVDGYPLLRQGVRNLLAQNVSATDLTHVYRAISDEIWVDSAHTNTRGYELVINRIVAKIREATESGAWQVRENKD